jgi:hypothetical protein
MSPAQNRHLACAEIECECRFFGDPTIRLRSQEWLVRVDLSGSMVAPRMAGIVCKRGVLGGQGDPPGGGGIQSFADGRVGGELTPDSSQSPDAAAGAGIVATRWTCSALSLNAIFFGPLEAMMLIPSEPVASIGFDASGFLEAN